MKNTGINKSVVWVLKALTIGLLSLNLVACGDDSSGLRASQPSGLPLADSRDACFNQRYNVGIYGNPFCPYQGQEINGRLEAFAQIEWSGAIYLDFGLQYNDACPPGQVPVYEYRFGQLLLNRCDSIGNDYVDFIFFQHHNSSSCAGGWAGDKNCIPRF